MSDLAQSKRDVDRPTALAAAIWLGIVGASVLLILPVFIGALVDDLGFSNESAGWIGSADLIGYALSSFAAFRTVRRIAWTRIVYTGLVLMLIGNLLSAVITTFWPLFIVRTALTGFGAGLLITVAYTLLRDTENRTRSTGIYWSFNVLGGAAGLIIFPRIIVMSGSTGMFLLLATTALSAVPFVHFWLPNRGQARDPDRQEAPDAQYASIVRASRPEWSQSAPVFLILGGIALFNFGLGGVWAFVERIGIDNDIEVLTVGTILSATYLVSMLGSAVASWQGDRFGYLVPYAIGITIMFASLGALLQGSGIAIFILALGLMNFAWNYCLIYQFSAVFANDESGRMSVFIIFFEAAGLMLGPGVAGFLVERVALSGALWMGLGCCAMSLLFFMATKWRHLSMRTLRT